MDVCSLTMDSESTPYARLSFTYNALSTQAFFRRNEEETPNSSPRRTVDVSRRLVMTTLQRFKFLAVQCAIAESPSRSPSASPALQLWRRRRKTLKKLLKETAGGSRLLRRASRTPDREEQTEEKKPVDGTLGGRKLKDLFVSSPTYTCSTNSEVREPAGERPIGVFETVASRGSAGTGTMRPIVALRYRLLRRAWRPVLVAIPE